MNSRFTPLHSRQRIWSGHLPGTEEPPTSIQPPHCGCQGSPSWARWESDGKGATQNTMQTQRSRRPISHASSCHQAHPTFSSPQKESFRGPGPTPPLLYPKLCTHSPWPSVGRQGQVSMFYLLHTTAPGWGLVRHPTDLDISRV